MKGLWNSNRMVRRLLKCCSGRGKYCEGQAQEKLEDYPSRTQNDDSAGHISDKAAEEFSNILTTIMGCGKILQMKIDKYDPAIKYVEQILAAADRAAELTRRIHARRKKAANGEITANLPKV